MQHDNDHRVLIRAFIETIAIFILSLIAAGLIGLLFQSCTKTVYVPVETVTVRNDSAYKAVYVDRLIIERDTVNTYTKGDTVFQERIKWRVRNTETHDTIVQSHTDSIEVPKPYPVEVVREVEKPLHWWQTALIWCGVAAIIGIAVTVWRLSCRHPNRT